MKKCCGPWMTMATLAENSEGVTRWEGVAEGVL